MGCGDIGSAIAHQLFSRGVRVVLNDLVHSTHARRGMAYTDALYDGVATLAGVAARHVPDVPALQACWRSRDAIPLCTLPDEALIRDPGFDVVIDATLRRGRGPPDRRPWARTTVGVGPGFVPGGNCHIAVESQWGAALGRPLRDAPTAPLAGGPLPLAGIGRARFATAPCGGLWHTQARIGVAVGAGEIVGHLGELPVAAPISGTLRGVTHGEVEVRAGQRIVEVDPRPVPQVFGLGERPLAVARGVLEALS
jgi:xanthine dehydrogenase accessory factor